MLPVTFRGSTAGNLAPLAAAAVGAAVGGGRVGRAEGTAVGATVGAGAAAPPQALNSAAAITDRAMAFWVFMSLLFPTSLRPPD
jgi:hypothetical protein